MVSGCFPPHKSSGLRCGLRLVSGWSPSGLRMLPPHKSGGLRCGLQVVCEWSPSGLRVVSEWSPDVYSVNYNMSPLLREPLAPKKKHQRHCLRPRLWCRFLAQIALPTYMSGRVPDLIFHAWRRKNERSGNRLPWYLRRWLRRVSSQALSLDIDRRALHF